MFSCLSEEESALLLNFLEKINEDWKIRYQETREDAKHNKHRAHHIRKDGE